MRLYHSESWELMLRRWSKLVKDFRMRGATFDISKIPDIYDCIKYDLQHNMKILHFKEADELYSLSRAMADIVVPQVCLFIKPLISVMGYPQRYSLLLMPFLVGNTVLKSSLV